MGVRTGHSQYRIREDQNILAHSDQEYAYMKHSESINQNGVPAPTK